jgi:glutamyl-tRNA reductase
VPHVIVVGLSHHTAPIDVRERVALAPAAYGDALARLRTLPGVREVAVLSTCNRSELYALTDAYHAGKDALADALRGFEGAASLIKDEHLFHHEGPAAVRHLFRVATSLDAMVVGEPQVLGQVKDAYRAAADHGALGPVLDRLFQRALEVGKRVRAETDIGAYAVSVSYAAVELAKKIFGPLEGRAALILGAGETGELTLKHLKSAGIGDVWVANRTRAAAEELALTLGGRAIGLDAMEPALAAVDIVVSQTGANEPVLKRDAVERAMKGRRGRPLFLVDIAVPRDVEAACAQVYNVFVYDIDDLGRIVAGNRERRAEEAEKALAIVQQETARFTEWFTSLDAVPTIVALRERFESVRAAETERALAKLSHLDPRDRKLIEQFGETLVHRLLHGPSSQLKHMAGGERGTELAGALRYLFRLEEQERGAPETSAAQGEEPPAEGGKADVESAPPRNRT